MSIGLKEFIKNHRDDINSQSFKEIYDELNSSFLQAVDVGKFTELLYTCGIDPLEYMSKIPDYYAYKSRFQSIVIPNNIISIGKGAFEGCTSLTSIAIPDSIIDIGSSAFSGCASLSSINIGKGVTGIYSRAFIYCISLASITIPNNVAIIGYGAFSYCKSLTDITIPDSVTGIGISAFMNCTSLASVTIGKGVTGIGYSAFANCTSLTNIKFLGTMAQWEVINKDGPIIDYSVPTKVVHCTDGDITL